MSGKWRMLLQLRTAPPVLSAYLPADSWNSMKRLLELKNKKVIKDFLFLFYKILVNGYVIYQSIVYQIFSDVKESVAALSRVPLLVTLWTVAHWAPLSMGFSRQEYWSELSFPPPGDLPNPEIEPSSLESPALARGILYHWASWEAPKRSKAGQKGRKWPSIGKHQV